MTKVLGILNITRDSFSDGGLFVDPEAALAHARRLLAAGADVIEVGAESTHPDSADVDESLELARLEPVVASLIRLRTERTGVASAASSAGRFQISVDTYKPPVMRRVLELGADMINDVHGFAAPGAIEAVQDSAAHLIVMHSRSPSARARRDADGTAAGEFAAVAFVDGIVDCLRRRVDALLAAGIDRRRIIVDPGMGMFLGNTPAESLAVLRHLDRLRALELPLCVSVSRKSFLGQMLADTDGPRTVGRRGAATLAAEVHLVQQGVEFIRTHDVAALRDAITILAGIART